MYRETCKGALSFDDLPWEEGGLFASGGPDSVDIRHLAPHGLWGPVSFPFEELIAHLAWILVFGEFMLWRVFNQWWAGFRRTFVILPDWFLTGASPVPHQCLTGASPVPYRVPRRYLTGASGVSHRCLAGASSVPHRCLASLESSM